MGPRAKGRELVKAAPRHTSHYGWRHTGLHLSDRSWTCANGHTLDRDVNAAVNITNKAIGQPVSAWEVYNGKGRVVQESHLTRATGVSRKVPDFSALRCWRWDNCR